MSSTLTQDAGRHLADLLSKATAAATDCDEDAVRDGVADVREVLASNAADTPLRSRLFHGCEAVERTLSEDPDVAAEYLRSMEARVRDGTES